MTLLGKVVGSVRLLQAGGGIVFQVLTRERYRSHPTGELKERDHVHSVSAFTVVAKAILKDLRPGRWVFVAGALLYRNGTPQVRASNAYMVPTENGDVELAKGKVEGVEIPPEVSAVEKGEP